MLKATVGRLGKGPRGDADDDVRARTSIVAAGTRGGPNF